MNYHYYVTDLSLNGTRDVIVVDEKFTLVGVFEEAILEPINLRYKNTVEYLKGIDAEYVVENNINRYMGTTTTVLYITKDDLFRTLHNESNGLEVIGIIEAMTIPE